VSDEAKDLISKLLVLDTKARLTVDQALGHAWIKKSDVELASRNLDTNLGELKKYQANRKFKKAAHTIIATQKFKNLLGAMKQAKKDTDAAEAAEADEGAAASPAVEEVLAPEST
jgi:calcium-dependent protein kinase